MKGKLFVHEEQMMFHAKQIIHVLRAPNYLELALLSPVRKNHFTFIQTKYSKII